MTIRKTTYGDIVRAVCKYPKAYLMHGSFGEALAFLEGYGKGARLDRTTGSFFNPFKDWLRARGWKDTPYFWKDFVAAHDDDQAALNEFARLWSEFEVECSKESKS